MGSQMKPLIEETLNEQVTIVDQLNQSQMKNRVANSEHIHISMALSLGENKCVKNVFCSTLRLI